MPHRPASLNQAFDVLGLPPGALPDEVKRAYRKLAMHWHPDRNPAPEATERFRQVRAAYDFVLSGGEEVADEAASQEPAAQPEPSPDPSSTPGPDQHETLWLTIEEAIFGTSHAFELGDVLVCQTCDGDGKIELGRSCLCEACHGSGRIRTPKGLDKCGICNGRGFVSVVPCEDCNGTGELKSSRKVRVTVPPLMWAGRRLRLSGQAEPKEGRAAGDLLLEAQFKPHALYRIEDDDLVMQMPVSGFDLLFGCRLRVPVPGGDAALSIEPCTGEVPTLSIDGHGLPRRSGGRGAMRVVLEPMWPDLSQTADQAALAALRAHLEARLDDTLPAVAQWRRQWLGPLDASVAEPEEAADTDDDSDLNAAGEPERESKARKAKSKKTAGKRKASAEKAKASDAKSRRKKS